MHVAQLSFIVLHITHFVAVFADDIQMNLRQADLTVDRHIMAEIMHFWPSDGWYLVVEKCWELLSWCKHCGFALFFCRMTHRPAKMIHSMNHRKITVWLEWLTFSWRLCSMMLNLNTTFLLSASRARSVTARLEFFHGNFFTVCVMVILLQPLPFTVTWGLLHLVQLECCP